MVNQILLKFFGIVMINVMNISRGKGELISYDVGPFIEKSTLKIIEMLRIYLPCYNSFTLKISRPTDAWFASYDEINFFFISPITISNVARKTYATNSFFKVKLSASKGKQYIFTFLLPHIFKIPF